MVGLRPERRRLLEDCRSRRRALRRRKELGRSRNSAAGGPASVRLALLAGATAAWLLVLVSGRLSSGKGCTCGREERRELGEESFDCRSVPLRLLRIAWEPPSAPADGRLCIFYVLTRNRADTFVKDGNSGGSTTVESHLGCARLPLRCRCGQGFAQLPCDERSEAGSRERLVAQAGGDRDGPIPVSGAAEERWGERERLQRDGRGFWVPRLATDREGHARALPADVGAPRPRRPHAAPPPHAAVASLRVRSELWALNHEPAPWSSPVGAAFPTLLVALSLLRQRALGPLLRLGAASLLGRCAVLRCAARGLGARIGAPGHCAGRRGAAERVVSDAP